MDKPRKYRFYGVLSEKGALLWGCVKSSPEEAQAQFDRYNPKIEGQERREKIVELTIFAKELD